MTASPTQADFLEGVEEEIRDFRKRMVGKDEEPELHALLGNALTALAALRGGK